eukprot:TRINITY_DN63354_c0_g2_i1.p1 TRINITY_DN63354_c0_g2~~TRINITY_DN63354_c0_g2_i1.p1  ORF type:complete len:1126 (+),score=241.03 TRINITY_DN63354_c0_g2_i1:142-3519(+)
MFSIDLFKGWTQTCGVRQIQKSYEDLCEKAKRQGVSIQEMMQASGFKDYQSFNKSCPRFSLTCWPSEFAELGSGYVLYFHFLTVLGLIFALMFVLQLPLMAVYSSNTWLEGWTASEDWTKAYSSSDPCACLGVSQEIDGLNDSRTAGYGSECRRWDVGKCIGQSDQIQNPGAWCCLEWCWASLDCPHVIEEDDMWKSNRRVGNLVRAVCPNQDQTYVDITCHKDSVAAADTPFNEPAVYVYDVDEKTVGEAWLSPGNLGPNRSTAAWIPFVYLVAVVLICLIIKVSRRIMMITDKQVDGSTTSPNDFAILVRGLPTTATDESDIRRFFEENALADRKVPVVKVVIGWDVAEYREKIRAIRELRKKYSQLDPATPEAADVGKEIQSITADLASSAPDTASRLRSSGLAVVIFRYEKDMRACLKRWNGFWARWFYSDPADLGCIPRVCKGAELPKFPIGDPPRPVNQIRLERAANPGDIHWEELGVDTTEKYKMLLKTNSTMAGLILLSFIFTWGLNKAGEAGAGLGGYVGQFLSILPAIAVAVLNAALSMAAMILGDKEYHETWTEQEFSQSLKMSIAMIVNTGGVLYFNNAQPREWYMPGGLIDDVFMMLLINSVAPPLMAYSDVLYRFKGWKRRGLTQEVLDGFNETHKECFGSKEPEQVKKYNEMLKKVNYYKDAFAPSPMKNSRRYANALKTFICCMFYSPVLPLVSLLGLVGIALQYWVDKYMLLRWHMRPARPANSRMALNYLRFVLYVAPVGLSVAFLLFLVPSFRDKSNVQSIGVLGILVSIGSWLIPSKVVGCLLCCCVTKNDGGNEDYYEAQYGWSKEMKYHKDHFMYKCLSEAKNPENLKPDADATVRLDDVKESYGVAAQTGAASEARRTSSSQQTRIHGMVIQYEPAPVTSVGYTPGAPVGGYVPGAPPGGPVGYVPGAPVGLAGHGSPHPDPAVIGAPFGGAGYAPGTPLIAAAPAPPPAAVVVAAAAAPPRWEYEVTGGYAAFNDDCQAFLERKYQAFKSGHGAPHFVANTAGKKVSIQLDRMTSKVTDSKKIRAIRRVGDGSAVSVSPPAGMGARYGVGSRVKTQYTRSEGGDGSWYVGTVIAAHPDGSVTIKYDDGDEWTGPASAVQPA